MVTWKKVSAFVRYISCSCPLVPWCLPMISSRVCNSIRPLLICAFCTGFVQSQTLTMVSGNGQIVATQSLSNSPLVVQAKDASGRPAPNVAITWAITVGSGNNDHRGQRNRYRREWSGQREFLVNESSAGRLFLTCDCDGHQRLWNREFRHHHGCNLLPPTGGFHPTHRPNAR